MAITARTLPTEYSAAELVRTHHSPLAGRTQPGSWDLEAIRAARDALRRGDFRRAAPLAQAVKTDPAVFGALLNRIAPHRGLPREFEADGVRVRNEAIRTFGGDVAGSDYVSDVDAFEHLAQIGCFVEQIRWTPREDGGRIDARLEPWPMSCVWYDDHRAELVTMTKKGIVPVIHGDGKWVVTRYDTAEPWQWGAVKAVAMIFAARAHHLRDRSLNSETHGEAKFIGTLPPDEELEDEDGEEFEELVLSLRNKRSGGLIPAGAKVEMLESMSQMWRIFQDAITSIDKDIARAYLGQDASLNNEGGNYIKSALLFGVRNDIVEGDLGARAQALNTGLFRPWSILNFGTDRNVRMRWAFPDADQDARREQYGQRFDAFNRTVKEAKANGFEVDQAFVDMLADRFGIDAPTLAEVETEPEPEPPPVEEDDDDDDPVEDEESPETDEDASDDA